MFASQPLPLEGTYNTRDIGNYPASRGRKTQTHQFLRSDSTENLTEQDMGFLQNYGLGAVFDLRSSVELKANPSPLEKEPWIDYYHLSFWTIFFPKATAQSILHPCLKCTKVCWILRLLSSFAFFRLRPLIRNKPYYTIVPQGRTEREFLPFCFWMWPVYQMSKLLQTMQLAGKMSSVNLNSIWSYPTRSGMQNYNICLVLRPTRWKRPLLTFEVPITTPESTYCLPVYLRPASPLLRESFYRPLDL